MLWATKLLSFVWFIAPTPIQAHQNKQKRAPQKHPPALHPLSPHLKRDLGLPQHGDPIQYMGETREP